MGGDEEGVRVTQFLSDILKDESGLGDTEMEPLLPTGDRVLAGVVLTENVGVFEGRGRSAAQLGVQAAADGEEVDGLLLALGALAGVLWLLGAVPGPAFASLFLCEVQPTMECLSTPGLSSRPLFKRQILSVLSSEQVAILVKSDGHQHTDVTS